MRGFGVPFYFYFFPLLVLGACGHNDADSRRKTQDKGAVDGGGGSGFTSSPQQVVQAIEEARQDVLNQEANGHTITRELAFPSGVVGADENTKAHRILLDVIGRGEKALLNLKNGGGFSFGSDYIEKSRFLIRDSEPRSYELEPPFYSEVQGPCLGSDGENDASVSRNAIGADICFSVQNLMKNSPNFIKKAVYVLLLHELAHINGYQEEDAKLVQKYAEDFYDEAKYGNGFQYVFNVYSVLSGANMALFVSYQGLQEVQNRDESILYLGEVAGDLESIDSFIGAVFEIEPNLKVANPDHLRHLSAQRAQLSRAIWRLGKDIFKNQLTKEELKSKYVRIQAQLLKNSNDLQMALTGRATFHFDSELFDISSQ